VYKAFGNGCRFLFYKCCIHFFLSYRFLSVEVASQARRGLVEAGARRQAGGDARFFHSSTREKQKNGATHFIGGLRTENRATISASGSASYYVHPEWDGTGRTGKGDL
jgi:hypothetical protein